MALFGSKKKKEVVLKTPPAASSVKKGLSKEVSTATGATIVTHGMKIEGNITGKDNITIDGEIIGNVVVNSNVVISKNGSVVGNIRAPKVVTSGRVEGTIECDYLEVLRSSVLMSKIVSTELIVHGRIEGEVKSEEVMIEIDGYVTDTIQAREIQISGSFEGDIACELLSTKDTATVKGGIFVKNISNQGGKIEGSIGPFKILLSEEEDLLDEEEVDKEIENPKEGHEKENTSKEVSLGKSRHKRSQ